MSATDFLVNSVTVLVLNTGLVWSGSETLDFMFPFNIT